MVGINGNLCGTVADVSITDIYGDVSNQIFQPGTLTTTATTADQVIVTYTVPAGNHFLLAGLFVGKSVATNTEATPFKLRVNGTAKIIYASDGTGTRFWNPVLNSFPIKIATAGDVVTITVTPSNGTSTTWNGTMFGYLRAV